MPTLKKVLHRRKDEVDKNKDEGIEGINNESGGLILLTDMYSMDGFNIMDRSIGNIYEL